VSAADDIDPDRSLWSWLAWDLRRHREMHAMTGTQVGKIMGCVRSTVSNMEAGRVRPDLKQCQAVDTAWKTGGHFARLHTFACLGHDPDWFRQHVGYEAKASTIKIYELAFIPGLFQTEDYARTLFYEAGFTDVEEQIAARLARQARLDADNPPTLWVLLEQGVIERPIGSPELMCAQLARLLELASRPNISLRVVPRAAGYHDGLISAFKVMMVGNTEIAYTEATGGGRLVQDLTEVRRFVNWYDRIGVKALPEHLSRDLIKQVMEDMA
jgi:DNA-binding XRE family transcriptional regulator